MPEHPAPKLHPRQGRFDMGDRDYRAAPVPYVELAVTSNFTFLRGASHPDEFVEQAATLGHRAVAITDTNSLAGVVRAHVAAKQANIPLVVGARLTLAGEGLHDGARDDAPVVETIRVLVYPTDLASYGRLCRLLTLGKRRAPKGECHLTLHDLLDHHEGLLGVLVPPPVIDAQHIELVRGLKRTFDDDRLSIAASIGYHQHDADRLERVAALCEHVDVPMVAINEVLYHAPERQPLQDVLTCIREGCTIEDVGLRLEPNAERHLKPAAEMARLFAAYPHAIERSVAIADRCRGFTLDQLRYQYPHEVVPDDRSPMDHLHELTRAGAAWRYPDGVPAKVERLLAHELALIEELDYPHYFLTVHDIVQFAESRGILCQGRGAAANSAVCYCLGVTAVDPERIDLLFERFVSRERNEPPDIDIDFEHERREEVIQYLYEKYGRERAALTAEVITYRARSAVREVGKALGLSLDAVDRLAKHLDGWGREALQPEHVKTLGYAPDDPTMQRLVTLARELLGFPRHLSQHVGGFVLTDKPLCELVPIENAAMEDRTVIEWDKDDIEALDMLKVDVLGLGMLTCVRKCFDLIGACASSHKPVLSESASEGPDRRCGGIRTFASLRSGLSVTYVPPCLSLSTIPPEDPTVYDMICKADTVGVFQIESRAQMSMLPRLRPRCFYDLVIEVAIVRPGPIQGDMVHPYLRRRDGLEPVTYPDDVAQRVLGKTLGVPLFQEQAMNLAIHCAGFSPDEAELLRKTIQAWRSRDGKILELGRRIIDGMLARGYPRDFADRCFEQIKGFGEYGFPESHAASFALLVYVSAWLKRHHPAAFTCALLNSQPMGFYSPAQIVRDAREHGVEVRPVDVLHSDYDCTLERTEHGSAPSPSGGVGWGEGERVNSEMDRRRHRALDPHPNPLPGREREIDPPNRSSAIRLGLRMVRGLREDEGRRICDAVRAMQQRGPKPDLSGAKVRILPRRPSGPSLADSLRSGLGISHASNEGTCDLETLWRCSGVRVSTLRRLAEADAFRSMGLDRQQALWQVLKLRDAAAPLFDQRHDEARPSTSSDPLPPVPALRQVTQDYASVGLSLKQHPMHFLRRRLDGMGVTPAGEIDHAERWPHGASIVVAGLVTIRQRPSTARGVVFVSLEDETGQLNLIVRPKVYRRCRAAVVGASVVLARGRVERQGRVVHINVSSMQDIARLLEGLETRSRDFH